MRRVVNFTSHVVQKLLAFKFLCILSLLSESGHQGCFIHRKEIAFPVHVFSPPATFRAIRFRIPCC